MEDAKKKHDDKNGRSYQRRESRDSGDSRRNKHDDARYSATKGKYGQEKVLL
jgi:hypothetical protein